MPEVGPAGDGDQDVGLLAVRRRRHRRRRTVNIVGYTDSAGSPRAEVLRSQQRPIGWCATGADRPTRIPVWPAAPLSRLIRPPGIGRNRMADDSSSPSAVRPPNTEARNLTQGNNAQLVAFDLIGMTVRSTSMQRLDYVVSMTRKEGSRRVFHVYGLPPPHLDEVIALPSDGEFIRAKIDTRETDTGRLVARET